MMTSQVSYEVSGHVISVFGSRGGKLAALPVSAICSVGWNLMELTAETEKHVTNKSRKTQLQFPLCFFS